MIQVPPQKFGASISFWGLSAHRMLMIIESSLIHHVCLPEIPMRKEIIATVLCILPPSPRPRRTARGDCVLPFVIEIRKTSSWSCDDERKYYPDSWLRLGFFMLKHNLRN